MATQKRALLSVSDKTGLVDFARGLSQAGFQLVSTGGTAKALEEAGLKVVEVSQVSGFPEIFHGRVKTLHPKILGGILARFDEPADQKEMRDNQIEAFHLVCVNLYPFAQTIARGNVPLSHAIEQIDVGGPTMIRAAAKNHRHLTIVVDPNDYPIVLNQLKKGEVSHAERFRLAAKAFAHTANYDGLISEYFHSFAGFAEASEGKPQLPFPKEMHLHFTKLEDLRYGENPHQKAAFYGDNRLERGAFEKLQGKELSFNNLLDAQAARALVERFADPACVIVKHTNPCGVGLDQKDLQLAYERALAGDPQSAFGGIVAVNRDLGKSLATLLVQNFLEVIIAPSFAADALETLKGKKNLRLLTSSTLPKGVTLDLKRALGGLLVQDMDQVIFDIEKARVVTKRPPTAEEKRALDFAWKVVGAVKSNAIVLAQAQQTVGIGAGQMSRVDSTKIALQKAGERAKGSVLGSDAFFPFRDSIDLLAQSGIRAIIQPGGSVRDEEVIQAANEHDIAMLFTGMRHFRH